MMYLEGEHVSLNIDLAARHFACAVQFGNSKAMVKLGVMFFDGDFVEETYKFSHELIEPAIDL